MRVKGDKYMPFIGSKVSVKTTDSQKEELKKRLGQAIAILPGKSERWLMVELEDEKKLYFGGDDSAPSAYITVSILGTPDSASFAKMTGEICNIYSEILGIKPDRTYVKYDTTKDWGWNGSNF
jgi:phenylpyruvate tautomerase PptA (4-oxalocrotonate tautomerase family)